jgi:Aspartyl/Asparaginyl beta-hydroxylase
VHFLRLATNLDVLPLLLALRQQPGLWGRSFRTTFPESPHREMLDCVLRCQVPEKSDDPRECYWQPQWACLPQARPLVYALMSRVDGERLGRVLLTWGVPGSQIYPHRDIGPKESGHYDTESYWNRYHVCLQAPAQSYFTCGEKGDEETVIMESGSCWWFNSALMHSCRNEGQDDRLHLIVDIHGSQMGR